MSARPRSQFLLALALSALVSIAAAPVAGAKPITKKKWLSGVLITEYFPAPEQWFVGKRVRAAGIPGKHKVDWLYSATGLSMEGDGIGPLDQHFHIENIGSQGWVNKDGKSTSPGGGSWSRGSPYWRAVGWRNHNGRVTFPLAQGGYSAGEPAKYIRPRGISFGLGMSRPLEYYRSIAVDPDVIPMGSRVYVPAYRKTAGGGWFRAADVGGAIGGKHIDVYRPPPDDPSDSGHSTPNQQIYVVPPK